MPRLRRTTRRLARPAVAVVLVFAQAVAAFGFPVARSAGVRPCGCVVACGTTPDCCCTAPHTPPPPPPPPAAPRCPRCVVEAEPEPPPPACPKCRAKEAPKPACAHCPAPASPESDGVTWVAAWKAKQCRGEGAGGLLAEIPAVPPAAPAAVRTYPTPTAFPHPADTGRPHFTSDPSDPPPR